MIARITGRIVGVELDSVLLEAPPFTYRVQMPPVGLTMLRVGEDVTLETTHLIQLEQSKGTPMLIGFVTEDQRDFWQILCKVLGPKSGLKAFSSPAEQIAQWVEMGDVASLKTLQGIGQAKAREMIAKLQGKLGRFAAADYQPPKGEGPAPMFASQSGPAGEATEALIGLDYKQAEAAELVAAVMRSRPDLATAEEILNEVFTRR